MTDKGVPVTEQTIQFEASKIAEQDRLEELKASKGWVTNFMRRKGITV